jgi:protoheme IX farnesyltransferase
MLKQYYWLTKPGIIYGNVINTLAGFFLASVVAWAFDGWLLVATVLGTSLIIGSGCVFNNYIDRRIDQKMKRTKKRALATGKLPVRNALIFGAVLGIAGFTLLALFVNWLVVAIGAIGYIDYIILYGYAKRKSVYGTLVGSISGSMPPVAGYCAVTGSFDMGAFLLFLLLTAWQMPHFYSIAMYRHKDYEAAGIPVLPVKKGMQHTKVQILVYIIIFTLATLLLTVFDYTGYIYFVVMALLGLAWLRLAIKGFKAVDDEAWARKMFGFSLVVTLTVAVMLPLGALLP